MQIRLTVVDPLGPPERARGRTASCDVLVTAPAGTALAAVASALASAVSGEGGGAPGSGAVVLYAGAERLDDRRSTLGEPPLIDGAVLSLGAPAEPEAHPELDDAPTQLHVVAGPDAGGVHLLHGGEIRIGRSADADVPLDDPDVSRFHCAVTVAADGHVSVADLDSTNGTTLDGTRVGPRAVRFAPGALLRIGESALRLTPAGGPGARVRTVADGEGCVRVPCGDEAGAVVETGGARADAPPAPRSGDTAPHARVADGGGPATPSHGVRAPQGHGSVEAPIVPGQGGAPRIERRETGAGDTHAGRFGALTRNTPAAPTAAHDPAPDGEPSGTRTRGATGDEADRTDTGAVSDTGRRKGTPLRGTDLPEGLRKRGGLSAWARKLAGGRGEQTAPESEAYGAEDAPAPAAGPAPAGGPQLPEIWPDPATLLLTALGPGPRLWERGPGHPEALTVRLGTADRAAPDGSGLLPAVPVTTDLREVGALGLAGPRTRLAGLGRAVVAQLAALHSPEALELVLISADRSRPLEERTAEWSWLGWLPHLRPAHGQDCRLLLAYDREQATARTDELLRRLEDQLAESGPIPAPASRAPSRQGETRAAVRRPSWALADDGADETPGFAGPYTVVVVDGDPGGAAVREAVARLALDGPKAGIHVVCLAETVSASPSSPVSETYEAACEVAPAFRECGAVALLSGDVATALRLMRVARGGAGAPAGGGVTASGDGAGPSGPGVAAGATRASGAAPGPGAPGAPGVPGRPQASGVSEALVGPGGPEAFAGPGRPGASGRVADPAGTAARGEAGGRGTGSHEAAWDTGARGTRNTAASQPAGSSPAHGAGASTPHDSTDTPPAPRTGTGAPSAPSTRTGVSGPPAGGRARAFDSPAHPGPALIAPGTMATVDAVSLPWAERFARALAPLRRDGAGGERHTRVSVPLPQSARLLDELGLARATPASLMARWADAADDTESLGGRAWAVLGAGPRGPVAADLPADGPHLLVEGPAGSGRTELLRAVVASLAAAERPDRLGIVLMDGRDSVSAGGGHGDGLRVCTDVPHVTTHLTANDPVRMREFAQSLSAELKRRAELLGRSDFAEWHTGRELTGRMVAQRATPERTPARATPAPGTTATGDLDTPPSSTMRLRPAAARQRTEAAPPLPRLVVVVDDLDALVSPALGSPGRPAAGSVIRALEAVARDGARLGVHLVAAAGPGGRTSETEPARRATLRVTLETPGSGPDEPAPGRGRLTWADGRSTPFQGGRVTGRIPRTATLRPTVVPLDWQRMGDPPTRRPVRELGNGPTDLALLASALERAAREVAAAEVPSLL
ncbi:FHA domain-containing protein [Streptomyces sp. NPDC005648]|uniref:FHA domain-containing protein n=1 Tax=Streptomyces sp. NPDC005648 TaxID=3157044 RepID=UPI0033AF751C